MNTIVRVLTAVFGFACLVASMKPVIEDNGSGWVYLYRLLADYGTILFKYWN